MKYDADHYQRPGCSACGTTRCNEGFRHGLCRSCWDMGAIKCVDCARVSYQHEAGRCLTCAVATAGGGA